jgi:prepilin-type N-terminal cleavage/methylation domain-containing protein
VNKENLQGFTLIELSIVLVVIGLIVGGVLVGQDLIKAAEVRAQISQIEKYNTAVNTFRGKFGAIPGDMNIPTAEQFGFYVPATCNGTWPGSRDGNGLIDGWNNVANEASRFAGEPLLFWQDLTTPGLTSLIDGSFPNSGAAAIVCGNMAAPLSSTEIGEYVPAGKIGRGTYVIVGETNGINYYALEGITYISANGAFSATATVTTPIPVLEAYKIDQKIDDGLPTSGNVQANYITLFAFTAAPNAASDGTTTCYNTSSNTYSIGYNGGVGANCALSFAFQ